MTREFYVTFGCQYAREPHPEADWAHPDGWLTIEASDETEARQVAVGRLGTAWASLYDQQPDRGYFPRGELHRITRDVGRPYAYGVRHG